jgi:ribonucleoside-diphosphate reductase alpha chain
MIITKKNGSKEQMEFDKITKRISNVLFDLDGDLDPHKIAIKVIDGLYDGVTTSEIDDLISETSAMMATVHPNYSQLAANISISSLQKQVRLNGGENFLERVVKLNSYINPKNGKHSPIVSDDIVYLANKFKNEIHETIDYSKDYNYDYFGFKTLERAYLLKYDGKILETPQDMLMRVSLGIHGTDWENAKTTYEMMSNKLFTHATPTLFNSGTNKPQMSSCFLLDMKDDSIDGIYDTLKQTAKISQSAGGIGLAIHKVRATGSYISGTNGTSNGIVPMLRVYNNTARYVDQGGGKRKGSFAVYLEPWHADIFDFLELKKNHGKEEIRARDLFYAIWTNDLFMRSVKNNEDWYLMCPNECVGLNTSYGEKFESLYLKYVSEGKYVKKIKARDLWEKIVVSQIETGTPYMLYKDSANEKSNQKNLGTIQSSNLCAEIVQYTDSKEVAVCNLASISLPSFVKGSSIDYDHLQEVAEQATFNLNRVIDVNYYPTKEAEYSNFKHRPIGLGVQGLADVFMLLNIPFDSDKARQINKDIFETIYYASVKKSVEIAKSEGAYSSFKNSPASKGILQFDLWDENFKSNRYDWEALKKDVVKFGLRNSLLTALMPTASTGQILGNNECFEPYTSNLYTRRTLSGEFFVINKHLIKKLITLDLWNDEARRQLMIDNGSVQNLKIPQYLKDVYKTTWEMSMKSIIDMSADRGLFIDQSQSMNLFMAEPDANKITSMHFYAWQKGLKTGMYYLRTKPAANAKKFTIDPMETKKGMTKEEFSQMVNRAKNSNDDEDCLMCSG